ncbi:MAG: hypothetical protein ACYCT6_08965 [bacterium]
MFQNLKELVVILNSPLVIFFMGVLLGVAYMYGFALIRVKDKPSKSDKLWTAILFLTLSVGLILQLIQYANIYFFDSFILLSGLITSVLLLLLFRRKFNKFIARFGVFLIFILSFSLSAKSANANSYLHKSFNQYVYNCVLPEYAVGKLPDINKTPDILSYMADSTGSSNLLTSTYISNTSYHKGRVISCKKETGIIRKGFNGKYKSKKQIQVTAVKWFNVAVIKFTRRTGAGRIK